MTPANKRGGGYEYKYYYETDKSVPNLTEAAPISGSPPHSVPSTSTIAPRKTSATTWSETTATPALNSGEIPHTMLPFDDSPTQEFQFRIRENGHRYLD